MKIIACLFCLGLFAAPSVVVAGEWQARPPAAHFQAASPTLSSRGVASQTEIWSRDLDLKGLGRPARDHDSFRSLAENLSTFGAVLLTAHEILASLRSWTDVLDYRADDGAHIELTKTPKGMGVMVLVDMPLQ